MPPPLTYIHKPERLKLSGPEGRDEREIAHIQACQSREKLKSGAQTGVMPSATILMGVGSGGKRDRGAPTTAQTHEYRPWLRAGRLAANRANDMSISSESESKCKSGSKSSAR